MEKNIYVLTHFNGWLEVSKDEAINFAKTSWNGIMTMNDEKKLNYINSKIKGLKITKEMVLE